MLEGQYARGERERLLAENERLRDALKTIDIVVHDCDPWLSSKVHKALSVAGNTAREALAEGGHDAPR